MLGSPFKNTSSFVRDARNYLLHSYLIFYSKQSKQLENEFVVPKMVINSK